MFLFAFTPVLAMGRQQMLSSALAIWDLRLTWPQSSMPWMCWRGSCPRSNRANKIGRMVLARDAALTLTNCLIRPKTEADVAFVSFSMISSPDLVQFTTLTTPLTLHIRPFTHSFAPPQKYLHKVFNSTSTQLRSWFTFQLSLGSVWETTGQSF